MTVELSGRALLRQSMDLDLLLGRLRLVPSVAFFLRGVLSQAMDMVEFASDSRSNSRVTWSYLSRMLRIGQVATHTHTSSAQMRDGITQAAVHGVRKVSKPPNGFPLV